MNNKEEHKALTEWMHLVQCELVGLGMGENMTHQVVVASNKYDTLVTARHATEAEKAKGPALPSEDIEFEARTREVTAKRKGYQVGGLM